MTNCNNIQFDRCNIVSHVGEGISVVAGGVVNAVSVRDCAVTGSDTNISLGGVTVGQFVISGGSIEGATGSNGYGVHVTDTGFLKRSLKIRDVYFEANDGGHITVEGDTSDMEIQGNAFYDAYQPIDITPGTGNHSDSPIIQGNYFEDTGASRSYDIILGSGVNRAVIINGGGTYVTTVGTAGVAGRVSDLGSNTMLPGFAAYAGIYCKDASTAQTVVASTPTKVTGFTNDLNDRNATSDSANDKITLSYSGRYAINFSVSFTGTASSTVEWFIRAGSPVLESAIGCKAVLDSSGNATNCACSAFLDLPYNADIEVWVESSSTSVTPIHMQLSAALLGN
jgi:hypothetical protein